MQAKILCNAQSDVWNEMLHVEITADITFSELSTAPFTAGQLEKLGNTAEFLRRCDAPGELLMTMMKMFIHGTCPNK